jgi:3-oxoacyl-[acyl-carrier protein] reductase
VKNILIVGGSSGVGLEIVNHLKLEHKVFVWSRTRGNLPESVNIFWTRYDALDESTDIPELPEVIHGLVYCPGSINLKPLRGLKTDDVIADFRINALGGFRVFQAVAAKLKASGSGSAVFFSTVAVGQGMPYHTSVSMAKGAVEGMVKALAAEMAPSIRVNAIAPSLTDTPMAFRLLSTEERRSAIEQRNPLKRIGKPDDIASAAVFLLSDHASWITGQIIAVDGGMGALKI